MEKTFVLSKLHHSLRLYCRLGIEQVIDEEYNSEMEIEIFEDKTDALK